MVTTCVVDPEEVPAIVELPVAVVIASVALKVPDGAVVVCFDVLAEVDSVYI